MERYKCGIPAIDLGTTNSLAAYFDEISKKGEPCEDCDGSNLLPSAVSFEKNSDNVVVGKNAKDEAKIYPDRTALRFKRKMGKTKEAMKVDGRSVSPQELSAYILKRLKQNLEALLEENVNKVVITVPAYFSNDAREATKEAARMSGMEVAGLIDEPVAALYHYDVLNSLQGKYVLVVDLGGGTLDIALVKITKNEINELIINGSTELGGSDFDEMFMKYLKKKYLAGKVQMIDEEQDLLLNVEKAKIGLSNRDSVRITASSESGRELFVVTRAEFEQATKPLMKEMERILDEVLGEIKKQKIKVDSVLMVGGATRMKQVEALIKSKFPSANILAKDRDEAVVRGAAVYAKKIAQNQVCHVVKTIKTNTADNNIKELKKITSRSYGTDIMDSEQRKMKIMNMIPKGSKIPVTVEKTFKTLHDNQKTVPFNVYEYFSNDGMIDLDNKYLVAKCSLMLNGNYPKGTAVKGKMWIDEDGTIHMKGELKGDSVVEIRVEKKALLSDEEIRDTKKRLDEVNIIC